MAGVRPRSQQLDNKGPVIALIAGCVAFVLVLVTAIVVMEVVMFKPQEEQEGVCGVDDLAIEDIRGAAAANDSQLALEKLTRITDLLQRDDLQGQILLNLAVEAILGQAAGPNARRLDRALTHLELHVQCRYCKVPRACPPARARRRR